MAEGFLDLNALNRDDPPTARQPFVGRSMSSRRTSHAVIMRTVLNLQTTTKCSVTTKGTRSRTVSLLRIHKDENTDRTITTAKTLNDFECKLKYACGLLWHAPVIGEIVLQDDEESKGEARTCLTATIQSGSRSNKRFRNAVGPVANATTRAATAHLCQVDGASMRATEPDRLVTSAGLRCPWAISLRPTFSRSRTPTCCGLAAAWVTTCPSIPHECFDGEAVFHPLGATLGCRKKQARLSKSGAPKPALLRCLAAIVPRRAVHAGVLGRSDRALIVRRLLRRTAQLLAHEPNLLRDEKTLPCWSAH